MEIVQSEKIVELMTMEGIKLLQTRVFHDNKVYLLASDIAGLMEYDEELFLEDYRDIICNLDSMPPLVLETDFNALLMEDDELIRFGLKQKYRKTFIL